MKVSRWWISLCVLATLNIAAWIFFASSEGQQASWQILLSGIYVFGCAFRSYLPVYDIPRICVVDTWASKVLIGRSVATLAELAFAAQWAVYLYASELQSVRLVAMLVFPLIAIAQLCCWHAVLTRKNLGHVFENSLWGISALMIVGCLAAIASQTDAGFSLTLAVWAVGGAIYVVYIFTADVPMYWSRWKTDQAQSRQYLSFAQGFADMSRRSTVSRLWEVWRSEVTWMTLYFSAGVWVSISLIVAAA